MYLRAVSCRELLQRGSKRVACVAPRNGDVVLCPALQPQDQNLLQQLKARTQLLQMHGSREPCR